MLIGLLRQPWTRHGEDISPGRQLARWWQEHTERLRSHGQAGGRS
jgi:hypothetical protein